MTAQWQICEPEVRACFVKRQPDSHKGSYGHVLAFVGSYGMAGAARLCTEAALRCGAGLVTAAVPASIYAPVTVALPEAVCLPLPEDEPGRLAAAAKNKLLAAVPGKSAIVAGCGLGLSPETGALLEALLDLATAPIILDADGLNWLAAHTNKRGTTDAPLCLTPHPGELARLMGCQTSDIQADRVTAATAAARQWQAVVVLKGHKTVIAAPNEDRVLINTTGTPGMATGGSGDVLAGMIASLTAQGMSLWQAAMCSVYLHGLAGEQAAARLSQHAMLPRDLLAELGPLFLHYE